jgi:hypothetical protein
VRELKNESIQVHLSFSNRGRQRKVEGKIFRSLESHWDAPKDDMTASQLVISPESKIQETPEGGTERGRERSIRWLEILSRGPRMTKVEGFETHW